MNVRFLPLARQELDDAFAWYEGQSSDLGIRFLDEIDRVLRRIIAFPGACTVIAPDIHRALVNRFPYGIIYGIDQETVVVLALAHLHREPRYWIDRLNEFNE
jgi:plasmid stabilization system protein ParE